MQSVASKFIASSHHPSCTLLDLYTSWLTTLAYPTGAFVVLMLSQVLKRVEKHADHTQDVQS